MARFSTITDEEFSRILEENDSAITKKITNKLFNVFPTCPVCVANLPCTFDFNVKLVRAM